MPIPAFDHNQVLPPHLGDPRYLDEISPYPCSMQELCACFATSLRRIEILRGLIRLRGDLRAKGVVNGFQWIDGSFLEDIEALEGRAPGDIDVATFFWSDDPDFARQLPLEFPGVNDPVFTKKEYCVDHYPIDIGHDPNFTVEMTGYWCGLFSHTREGVWKGMLRVELDTPEDDIAALEILGAIMLAMEAPL